MEVSPERRHFFIEGKVVQEPIQVLATASNAVITDVTDVVVATLSDELVVNNLCEEQVSVNP